MLFQIAWRNIWRNPLRSGLVMVAISLGLWAAVFMFAFSFGMMESRTRDILQTQISHLQFHNPEYEREDPGSHYISDSEDLMQQIAENPTTASFTSRFLANGILNSTRGRKGTFGVQIVGISPEQEAQLTSLPDRVIHGDYFQESGRRVPEIILGKELAEKIGVLSEDEEGKIVFDPKRKLTLSNIVLPDGGSAALRVKVVGVYKAQNTALESLQLFINKQDLQSKLGLGDKVHEIAVLIKDGKELAQPQKQAYQLQYEDSAATRLAVLPKDFDKPLKAGRYPSPTPSWRPEVLLSSGMASRLGLAMTDSSQEELKVDRTLWIRDFSLQEEKAKDFKVSVVGIYEEEKADGSARILIPRENFYFEAGVLEKFEEDLDEKEVEKIRDMPKEADAQLYTQTIHVQSWNELAPEIEIIDNQFSSSMRIMVLIILFALGFGIVNTMLMAILERTRELGMLMSIGMNRLKVFLMIMLETVLLTFIGAPIGMGVGWLTIYLTHKSGIDLSGIDMGASDFGMANIVNPSLPTNYYYEIAIMVIIAGILASIYPALRAIRLRPAEAVRAI